MTTIATPKDAMAAARTRMEKAVEDFRKELATLRTGRANAAILDAIRVDYHGTPMPVNQLGTVTVPDPSMLVISPWDPGAVPLIDKAHPFACTRCPRGRGVCIPPAALWGR